MQETEPRNPTFLLSFIAVPLTIIATLFSTGYSFINSFAGDLLEQVMTQAPAIL